MSLSVLTFGTMCTILALLAVEKNISQQLCVKSRPLSHGCVKICHHGGLEWLIFYLNHQDSPNPHVMDNVHAIMSSAASKFSLAQFEHLTG